MIKIYIFLLLSLPLWANIGNIMVLKGKAEVLRDSLHLKASAGMELLKGDQIQTFKDARVQVMLRDDTVVTIGAKSLFGFEDFEFGNDVKPKVSMKAVRGFFRSVTGKIGKIAPERFKVKTASATIGIRGTDFSGEITPGKEVFKCYSGAINVAYEGGSLDIKAGNFVQLKTVNIKAKTKDEQKIKGSAKNKPQESEKGKIKSEVKSENKVQVVKKGRLEPQVKMAERVVQKIIPIY